MPYFYLNVSFFGSLAIMIEEIIQTQANNIEAIGKLLANKDKAIIILTNITEINTIFLDITFLGSASF